MGVGAAKANESCTASVPASKAKPPAQPTRSALYVLAEDPAKQRAAWELMKFLTSEHGYTIIQSKIGYRPASTGHRRRPEVPQELDRANPLVLPNLSQLDRLAAVGRLSRPELREHSQHDDEGG